MVDSYQPTRSKNVIALAISLGAVVIASALGGLASATSAEDYQRLQQPSWAPPSWVFGPVWTVLYTMMAVAAWLVWRSGPWSQTRPALTAYGVQLVLNAAWTPLFFGLGWRGIAFAELSVLWLVLVGTVVLFFRRSAVAGWLLIPYLAWSTFALCLNFAVWQLNS
ncbi:tryptophan-rich sensory protein [Mycolicibacterium rufum]|uniref:Tryptophan-rich sensory protein n=1 Tax=Mycolicibacterium rufum TaxID=318424 RepID=A0A9X2YAC5_9MYCO|nr:TspO/MBR family protein [Mycolicibacterium rufum]KGI66361.1 peripheral-type benzodiazepine receptor [Mycolicibacterium rufum]MCV7069784.1 tryptophan-rich sensory protein [Mycolicibacterium rufum]ULP37115.1 tryptophan-rich sensory protein [Mycolicibacterium rufum]